MRSSRLAKPALCCAFTILALAAAHPLLAYVVWLKDGSHISARDKYEVQNDRALITLPNGVQTFIALSKIDVAKSDEANRTKDYGTTDLGNTRVMPGHEVAPQRDNKITDLIASHSPSQRQLPTAKRTGGEARPGEAARSKAGNIDFTTLPHSPYAHLEVTTDLRELFNSQGLNDVGFYTGSEPDRLMLEFVITSEASIFQSLNASAAALLRAQERFPKQVPVVEVLMRTPTHERAGQFLLTPGNAADLVGKKVDASTFYVANVQF